MKANRPSTLLSILGLLAILFGTLGILVVLYLHVNPLPFMPPSSSQLLHFMSTAWGVITNGALIVSGIGILQLKNWARPLIILYAIISSIEYIINYSSIPEGQYPAETIFLVMVVPLAFWVSLIYIFTRPSITRQFIPEKNIKEKGIGWGTFGLRFLGSFIIYAIISHIFSPYPLILTIYSPYKIFVYYILGYLSMFLIVFLVVSMSTVIIAKSIPKYRSISTLKLLNSTLLPAIIILCILTYGGWYGRQVIH